MKNHKESEQKNAEGKKESGRANAHIDGAIQIELGQDLKKQHKTEYNQTTSHNNRQLVLTVITAGLVFIYTGLMFWQGCSTKKAADAAQSAAKTAEGSLINAQKSFNLDQRPWVGVRVSDFTLKRGESFRASIVLINTGKTPAYNGSLDWGTEVMPARIDVLGPGGPGEVYPPKNRRNTGAIPPQGHFILTVEDEVSHDVSSQYDEIVGGKKFLYIRGRLLYWTTRTLDPNAIGGVTFCLEYDRYTKSMGICQPSDMW